MNGFTKTQSQLVKTRFDKVLDSQAIIRKCMPEEEVDESTRSIVLESINVDDTILKKSDMEVFEIPIKPSKKTAQIFDLNCKITRQTRYVKSSLGKVSGILSKVVAKSENFYGVTELASGGTANTGTTAWTDAIPLRTIVKEIQVEVEALKDHTEAAINMIVPSAKKVFLTAPINDYGHNPKQFLPDIANIYTSTAITDKAILVPFDSTICSLARATKLKVAPEVFEQTKTKLIATEAIGPVIDEAKGVRVMSI
ncbi:hypothetical protein [Methanococcus maripaludis]|uniref:Uncharacterized protein n=1 Tax=Methanococcus maripaludis TaxID=39152 RepID=A0A7J9S5B3_METMI|nr:hypothetical protein [Methanococcus maripaludis]MBB6067872.1 hypothetical protein [Methanococcus maripaludis]